LFYCDIKDLFKKVKENIFLPKRVVLKLINLESFLYRFYKSKGGSVILFEIAPENPVLWTGMKGVSAKGRKNLIRC